MIKHFLLILMLACGIVAAAQQHLAVRYTNGDCVIYTLPTAAIVSAAPAAIRCAVGDVDIDIPMLDVVSHKLVDAGFMHDSISDTTPQINVTPTLLTVDNAPVNTYCYLYNPDRSMRNCYIGQPTIELSLSDLKAGKYKFFNKQRFQFFITKNAKKKKK